MNQTYPGRSHLRTSRWRIQVVAILAILALLLGVGGVALAAPGPQPDATVAGAELHLVGPAVNPRVGETFQVQVHVQDVVGLAGYQVTLNYDNTLVHAVSVSGIESFLNAPTIPVGLTLTSGLGGLWSAQLRELARMVPAYWPPSPSRPWPRAPLP